MKRDLAVLADRTFDLVVVGAGVYGCAVAWDAVLRGLTVALIDKGDFGSGTSFNNLKTIHGGIRYLQHGDLKRIRESVRERRNLMAIAPHLVHPLPFLVPTYQGAVTKSRFAMRIALALNDWLSWDRNEHLTDKTKHLPAGRALSRDECLSIMPGLPSEGLTGGVLWYDAQMFNSDRLTLSFALSATERGAVAANFVEATGFSTGRGRIRGVVARDVLSGTDGLEIRGSLVVNAAGPWVDGLIAKTGQSHPTLFHLSKAMNLVTRPVVSDVALGVTSARHGRFFCLIPWRNACLIGTSHAPYEGEPDGFEAREEDVAELLADVNDAYPEARLGRDDVRLIHRGLLPRTPGSPNGSVTLLKTYHLDDSIQGLLSIVGVKYTTARDVAEKAVDRALAILGRELHPSRSRFEPLVGGDIPSFRGFMESLPYSLSPQVREHLALNYGTRYRKVTAAGGLEPVCEGAPVLDCEVRHVVREEMALDLPSVVLRRTDLGTAGHPGRPCLEAVARIVQSELSWSDVRRETELEAVEAFYRQRS